MKKLLYCAAALGALLFAGSCQRENLEPAAGSGTVTFTVKAPDALATKGTINDGATIADGENVNVVHYALYKTNDDEPNALKGTEGPLAQGKVDMKNKQATAKFDLLQDQEYTILFWAQVTESEDGMNAFYELGDLREITLKKNSENEYDGNNEKRAAFYARYDFSTENHKDHTVTLYRPFSQLNLLTTKESLAPKYEGQTLTPVTIDVKESMVTVHGTSNTFDMINGTGLAGEEQTFSMYDTPAKQGQETLTVNEVAYHYVSMNYLFVPDDEALLTVDYEIVTDKGNVTNTVLNVPLKENYRTNIIGNLLTKETQFNIVVDANFDGTYVGPEFVEQPAYDEATKTWTITNADELAWVAASVNGTLGVQTKAGGASKNFSKEIIVLANDIDLQGAEWDPIGNQEHAFAGTFDGKNHTISNFKVTEKAGWAGLFGRVQVGTVKNLNVKNVTIETNHYAGAIVGQGYVYMDNCHAENVNITVSVDPEVIQTDGTKGDYGDKAGGLVGQNCEGGLKITNSSANNVKIIGYRDLGGIVGMAHNGNIVTGNTVENITLVQNLEYGYNSTIPTTLGGVVGRFGSDVKYEGNTESGVVYDYPTVLSYDSTKSAVENGQILFDTVKAAEDGDIILLTAGDWRGTDGETSRYTVNKDVTIIGLEEGVVLSSDKYGRVVDSEDADNAGVVTFKNLTMKTDHTWAAALYAKNYVTVNLIDVTLQTAGATAILLDSSNKIKIDEFSQHHNANTIVNVTNVTIDEGDSVELNANPCTSYQTDIVSYASFNYDETSNIGIVKPQGITRSTGDNLFVNGVALPAGYYVTNTSELKATSGRADASVINLFPGEYAIDGVTLANRKFVGYGENVVLDMVSKKPNLNNGSIAIENIKINFANTEYFGFQHVTTEYYKDCTISGMPFLYGSVSSTFDHCTFDQTSSNAYNVWTYGAKDVTFNECTFNSAGKSVLIYSDQSNVDSKVTFNDCELNASTPVEGKAAVEIDASLVTKYVVYINRSEANGFALGSVSKSPLWNIKKGADKAEVYVDGKEAVADGLTKEGDNYYVSNAAGLAYFSDKQVADGTVINLTSDIDFKNAEFKAIAAGSDKSFTFNGNNKTISNIKLVKSVHNSVGAASLFFCFTGGTININDLIVDNAQSEGATYVGTILSYTQGAATVKNVTVKNSSISGEKKVGGLVGFVEASTSKFLAENCKIINTTVVATEKQAGTIIGYNAKPAELNNCTVETSTATSPLYCDGGIVCTDPAQAELIVDGAVYVVPVIVTPENIATTDFNQSKTFKLKGDFTSVTNVPSITPTEGVVAVIDASEATFGDKIQFNIPEVPGNSNVVSRDNARKGSYTLTNFHGTTLDLGAYGTSVTITKSTLDCIDVFATNIALDINHNTIDSNYEMHPRCNSGETDYAVYMMMMAYDLKFDNNKVSNAIGHVVAINGGKNIGNFATVTNSSNEVKSFTGNTITGISGSTKNNRAGFKVWDDMTYACQGESTYEALPQAGQNLIDSVENANTFEKAEGTSNNAYKINFYAYYHAAL